VRLPIVVLLGFVITLSGCASQEKLMTSLSENDVATAKEMVQKGINPFKTDESGQSAVSLGLEANESSDVYRWAQALAEESSVTAKQLLDRVTSNTLTVGEFRAELEKTAFYVDASADEYGNSLLNRLSRITGKTEYVSALLDHHASTERANSDGWTPLIGAIFYGNVSAADILISAGASLDAKSNNGWTALHYTTNITEYGNRANDAQLARLLIGAGADLNSRTNIDATPLYNAIWNDRSEVWHVLLEAGADPNLPKDEGWTPLMQAVFDGNTPAAEALILAGASLDKKENEGWTALHFTANAIGYGDRTNDAHLAHLLIDAGANLNTTRNNGTTPLYTAISNDRDGVRQILIEAGADVDLPDDEGWTPLIKAIFDGNRPAAEELIAAGAYLDAKANGGWTALHFTANAPEHGNRANDDQLTRILIEAGASLNTRKNNNATPLYTAISNGRAGVRRILLEAGADADLPDDGGWTPLMLAIFDGDVAATEALIAAGANLDAVEDDGWTALHFTANVPNNGNRAQDTRLAHLLISAGANLNARKNDDATPLSTAVSNGREGVLQALIEAGADTDLPDDNGWTPLMQAVFDGDALTVEALIAAGANLEAKSDKGWTALHFTANVTENGNRANDAVIAEHLIHAGANPNSLNDELVTPLMLSGMNNREAVARTLLTSGAQTEIKNKFGRTAEDEAIRADNYRIVALIREHKPTGASRNTSTDRQNNSLFPAKPAPRSGYVTCNTRCLNANCYRTYSDGRQTRFQAERKYNPLSGDWEYDSGSC